MKSRRLTIWIATILCAGLLVGFLVPFVSKLVESLPAKTAAPGAQSLLEEDVPLADPASALGTPEPVKTATPAPTPQPTPSPTATPEQKPSQRPRSTPAVPTPTQAVPVEPGTTVIIEDDPIPIADPD